MYEKMSILSQVHLISFSVSNLILCFLADYRNLYPYNYVALCLWAGALMMTVASSGAIILQHCENQSRSEDPVASSINTTNQYNMQHIESYDPDAQSLESRFELWGEKAVSNVTNTSKRSFQIVAACLMTAFLSSILVYIGIRRAASDTVQAETAHPFWLRAILMIWICAGIVDIFPRSERAHGCASYFTIIVVNAAKTGYGSFAGILIFCTYILYDTSKVKTEEARCLTGAGPSDMIDVLLAVPVPRRRHRVFCKRDSGKQIPSIFRAIPSAAHAGRAQAAAVPFAGHRAPVPPGPPLDNRQRATLAALCLAGRHGSPKLGWDAHAT